MTSYSNVQKQQLSQLGAYLQEKRQEQGKSLEDISLETYIRTQLLKAVENGDPSDLPQPIFVQGFIRRYADALGLDGANLSKQFPVHSIPNTPRPVPQPATKVDMSYQTALQNPPIQTKLTQPKSPKPAVGALPIQNTSPKPSAPTKPTVPEPVVNSVSPTVSEKNGMDSVNGDIALDPHPMSDSELNALGLGSLTEKTAESAVISTGAAPLDKQDSSKDVPLEPTEAANTSSPEPSPLGAMPAQSRSFDSSASDEDSSTLTWLPWAIGAAAVVGVIALLIPIIGGGSNKQPQEAETPQSEIAQVDTVPTVQPEVAEPEPELAVSDAPVNVEVEITDAGPSWMRVIVDGDIAFEGLLYPGTKESWEGQEYIDMTVGNAGAALISSNGSEPVPAGNPGGAEVLTFTAEE